jgi:hypothetical protein
MEKNEIKIIRSEPGEDLKLLEINKFYKFYEFYNLFLHIYTIQVLNIFISPTYF